MTQTIESAAGLAERQRSEARSDYYQLIRANGDLEQLLAMATKAGIEPKQIDDDIRDWKEAQRLEASLANPSPQMVRAGEAAAKAEADAKAGIIELATSRLSRLNLSDLYRAYGEILHAVGGSDQRHEQLMDAAHHARAVHRQHLASESDRSRQLSELRRSNPRVFG